MSKYELKIANWDYYSDILEMCQKFHQASPYRETDDYDESKVAEFILSVLNEPVNKVIITVVDTESNKAVGMLMAVATEPLFNRSLTATEIIWWLNPECRKSRISLELIDAYIYWATVKVKCSVIQLGLVEESLNAERLAKFYNRKGFTLSEKAFIKRVV